MVRMIVAPGACTIHRLFMISTNTAESQGTVRLQVRQMRLCSTAFEAAQNVTVFVAKLPNIKITARILKHIATEVSC